VGNALQSYSNKPAGVETILDAFSKLECYIVAERYRGYDPYDGLSSPVFKLPLFRSNRVVRLGAQQILKRFPVNIRPCIGIVKGYNPVSLGLCLQAYSCLLPIVPEKKDLYLKEIQFCIDEIEKLQSVGYSGACWGYDFDWEGRYARIPARTPTIVATGIVTDALFRNYKVTGNQKCLDLCKSAVNFLAHDLLKTYRDATFCYSYSPLDRQIVLNATMMGARLLAQVYSVVRETRLIEQARATVRFVIQSQGAEGSWSYSLGDSREWVDNFHTGYILECLDEYIQLSGDSEFKDQLRKGLAFYTRNFFEAEQIPKYYADSTYPVDCTAGAQSIITLSRFGYLEKAKRVALWLIWNMQAQAGFFYYQKYRHFTSKISYMRWSNAWMFCAFAYFISRIWSDGQKNVS
jgi:hypothetical protein